MIHGVCDELLAVLDLGRSLLGQVVIDVHVIDVGHGVDRHFVVLELLFVVEIRPVIHLGDDLCSLAELAELREVFEHAFVDLQDFSSLSEV